MMLNRSGGFFEGFLILGKYSFAKFTTEKKFSSIGHNCNNIKNSQDPFAAQNLSLPSKHCKIFGSFLEDDSENQQGFFLQLPNSHGSN